MEICIISIIAVILATIVTVAIGRWIEKKWNERKEGKNETGNAS